MEFAEKRVALRHVDLAFNEAGMDQEETIVFGHSLFFDKTMFAHQLRGLSDRYHIYAYDHRGHGASGRAADDRYDMDVMFDDAAGFIESLGCGPVHYAGNSMGGFVALRLAARRPDLVKSVIALGSSGESEEPGRFDPLETQLLASGGAGLQGTLGAIFFGQSYLNNAAVAPERELWLRKLGAIEPFHAKPGAGVSQRSDILKELRHSSVPVLAVAGAEDQVYPVALSENIAAAAANGISIVIEGAGHSVALEQPLVTNEQIHRFIANLPERSGAEK